MGRLFDWLQSLPKPVLVILAIALISLLGYGMFVFVAGDKLDKKEEIQTQGSVLLDFPDGTEVAVADSKLDELHDADKPRRGRSSADDYWSSLAEAEEGGLLVGEKEETLTPDGKIIYNGEVLDPAVYTELEIYYITKGLKTRQEIDKEKAELKAINDNVERRRREDNKRHEEMYSDSAYYARMEKAFQLAQKYSQPQDTVAADTAAPAEEPRRIELDRPLSKIASTSLHNDDIISSLDSPSSEVSVNEDGSISVSPAKATFLKTEKLVSGQRVIMRLVQDLHLSDGTMIPANTHVSGICRLGDRLNITITTINYGGRIYYTNIDVYDNDGTEGIYCPVIVDDKAGKSSRRLGRQLGKTASSLIGGAATLANPYVGLMTGRTLNEVTRSIDSEGNMNVTVSSGYEFYVYENVNER